MNAETLTERFSSITIGDDIPDLVRGPMTPVHLMRWSSAIENWHRIHYDKPFALEHEKLPDLLVNGSWKQHFVVQGLREWAEPDGWLLRVAFEFRQMDVVGSTLTAWGRVVKTSTVDGLGYVELATGIRNEHGVESTPGSATVVFPLTVAVPYPFPALS